MIMNVPRYAPRQRTRGVRSVDGATPRAAVLLLLASGIRAQQAGNGGAPVAQVAEAHGVAPPITEPLLTKVNFSTPL
jgi:hypothetical protein